MKALLFDNDGTLVDSESLYFKATQQVLASVGVEMTKKWFIEESLLHNTSSWSLAEAKGIPEEQIDELRKQRNALYSKLLEKEVALMPGVRETLERLFGHYIMGIVTGSRKPHFDIIMQKTGIRNFFDFVITQEDAKKEKPNPDPYLKALQLSQTRPHDCIAIEDTEKGLISANRAQIPCLVVPHELSKGQSFMLAERVMKSFSEIVDYLLKSGKTYNL